MSFNGYIPPIVFSVQGHLNKWPRVLPSVAFSILALSTNCHIEELYVLRRSEVKTGWIDRQIW